MNSRYKHPKSSMFCVRTSRQIEQIIHELRVELRLRVAVYGKVVEGFGILGL